MLDNKKREEILTTIYQTFKKLDPSGKNTENYQAMFEDMSNDQLDRWLKKFLADEDMNFYLDIAPFKREPNMDGIIKAANYLKVPLTEHVVMPWLGKDEDGNPVMSQYPVPVGYLHHKRVQQMAVKKNSTSTNIDQRDPKTGQVINKDKNARASDVENYALEVIGAEMAAREFMGPRADDMVMKREMYSKISLNGFVSMEELPSSTLNKTALNTANVYFLGAGLITDLVTDGYKLPRTLEDRGEVKSTSGKFK